ncbi:MAG: hypothetical protein VW338_04650 [Rhodospirillaceae bacterium]
MRTLAVPLVAVLSVVPSAVGADVSSVRVVDENSGADPAEFPVLAAQAAREYEKLKSMFGTDVGVITVRVQPKCVARHLPPADIVIPARLISDGARSPRTRSRIS